MKEVDIQRLALEWLKVNGVLVWRCSLGGIRKAGGTARNPLRGFPDCAGIIPQTNGRFFVIEFKADWGRLSPEQVAWRERLEGQGVLYVLARSLDDVVAAILPLLAKGA